MQRFTSHVDSKKRILMFSKQAPLCDRPRLSPLRSVIVLGTPRSGTTYLCEALSQTTGVRHEEWFCESRYGKLNRKWISTLTEIVSAAGQRNTFGVKLLHYQLQGLLDVIPFSVWPYHFGSMTFLRTRREDKKAQAASWAKALADKTFVAFHSRGSHQPSYNLDDVAKVARQRLAELEAAEKMIDHWVAVNGVTITYEIRYEHLQTDVAAAVSLAYPPTSLPIKQSDGINQQIMDRM